MSRILVKTGGGDNPSVTRLGGSNNILGGVTRIDRDSKPKGGGRPSEGTNGP